MANYHLITHQNTNTNDKRNYGDSVGKNVIDSRVKLHEYYSENKIAPLNQNMQNNPDKNRKYTTITKEKREEEPIKLKIDSKHDKETGREKDKYLSKNKNEYDYPYYPKKMPLPAEKNFNLNIDFNQFDQFSPPSNQNLIIKNNSNFQYEYNNTFNKIHDQSSKYGMIDLNYAKRNSNINGNYNYSENKQHYDFKEMDRQNKVFSKQDVKGEKFTRKSDSNQFNKDISSKNYLYSKLLKTTSEKVSIIPNYSKR
jgi:hypothetical protein